MKKKLLFIFCFALQGSILFSQSNTKCSSHNHFLNQSKSDPAFLNRVEEQEKFTQQYARIQTYRGPDDVVTLPVVVHVIHKGEAEGSGTNISLAQIQSQIDVLNKDFRLKNSDTLNALHPFHKYISDIKIEFCLAVRDPNGNATNGVTRHNMLKASWHEDSVDVLVKPNTTWDRTKYVNIWVADIQGTTLGWATFPGTTDATDGIVIRTSAFGTNGTASAPNDLGRTASHEVGHYLNLRHIWGDEACGNDSVTDTPVHKVAKGNYNCPTFPFNALSTCGTDANGEMFMNYMDYVDDACMNMFTTGQKTRMRAALFGARASLLTSNGCSTVTSVEEFNKESLTLYPNPAQNQVTASLPQNFSVKQIEILNVQGQVVKSNYFSENNSSLTINTEGMANGIYILKLTGNTGVINKELIILK